MRDGDQVKETRREYGEQDEWGNSIASLRANLKLTPLERLRKAEAAANSLRELKTMLGLDNDAELLIKDEGKDGKSGHPL